MIVRDAQLEDAPAACQVLRRSVTELCVADHGNDPAILTRWLGNKTVENVASWIAQPANSLFRGVSRSMLRALESRAAERGNTQCTLSSTETAREFYLSAGYVEIGPPDRKFGAQSGYPMSKHLVPHSS
jgi:hypothetical protein